MIQTIVSVRQYKPSKLGMAHGSSLLLGLVMLGSSEASQLQATNPIAVDPSGTAVKREDTRMWMTVGERRFAITLADNPTASAFAARLPLTLDMADLNRNEKHADLSDALPTDSIHAGTIHNGDLMLYGSKTIVVFYDTFRSSYSYTRLGRINDANGMAEVLGQGTVRINFFEK